MKTILLTDRDGFETHSSKVSLRVEIEHRLNLSSNFLLNKYEIVETLRERRAENRFQQLVECLCEFM